MDGEQNGSQEATQGAESTPQQQGQEQQEMQQQGHPQVEATDYEKQIAERDARIAELEGQVAEVAEAAWPPTWRRCRTTPSASTLRASSERALWRVRSEKARAF